MTRALLVCSIRLLWWVESRERECLWIKVKLISLTKKKSNAVNSLSLYLDCCEQCPKFGRSRHHAFSSSHRTIGSFVSEREETDSWWIKSNSSPHRSLSLVHFRALINERRSFGAVLVFALRPVLVGASLRPRRKFVCRRTDLFPRHAQPLCTFWFSSRVQSIVWVSCD